MATVTRQAPAAPAGDYERLERATAALEAPFAVVDLDAFWANAADMLRRAGGTPIRVASKSVRCRALLRAVHERDPGFHGTLAFTLPEALWLASHDRRCACASSWIAAGGLWADGSRSAPSAPRCARRTRRPRSPVR